MRNIVVVGNGMVGHHFVEQWLANPQSQGSRVTILAAEDCSAYDRVHLSEVFEKGSAEHLMMGDQDFYQHPSIDLHLNEPARRIDRAAREVITDSGRYPYDELVLAQGSYPFVPPIPGKDQPECFVYRTLRDLDAIQACAKSAKVGVVIGGGLLGLEAANALKSLGLQAHVVEFAPRLMPVQLDDEAGAALRAKIEALGVTVHTDMATQKIERSAESGLTMHFADGSHLDTDLIVFSAGIRPYDDLASEAGLTLGSRGGIAVNDACLTSDPSIYAIGECAVWQDRQYGLVAPGYSMARAVAGQLAGGEGSFTGADMSTKLKLLGVDVGSIGDAHGQTEGSASYQLIDQVQGIYKRLVVSPERDRLIGAILIGDNSSYDTLLQYVLNELPLPQDPEGLLFDGETQTESLALPLTATLCSCHNVSRGDIVDAMDGGCCNLAEVKDATKAGTGCGGCSASLKQWVDEQLETRGVEVDKSICRHFDYTRQELFDLIRVERIRSFDQLLQKHGSGGGCEICKPAAASMLASVWNEHIQEPDLVHLQDTNDTFMANMQKDGTYSVVPRIPGGEIKPEMLVVLGQIGVKYKLYTKITGGQRIDLFGATLDELPLIWEELIDAGFETGHAYGKSLRTVKSCVGSTWCRYGVQDSATQAIDLENRYKGLRSPHKLKMAVSGCTRECAEAQSKDIGVIATEKGWNLFVGGNGGMRPRHADLFATDIDTDTLIRYIDRILMFYVYTADRLQRTSVWLENLEGGLDYLRAVVIDDSLGLCDELEQRMQQVVDTYQCEWKTTISDPSKRARFRSFINEDQPRKAIVQRIEERGQLIPVRQLEETEA